MQNEKDIKCEGQTKVTQSDCIATAAFHNDIINTNAPISNMHPDKRV